MESGDILGHENMGEVIELGSEVTNLKIDNWVVVRYSSRTFFRPATWPPSTRRSSRATRSRSGAVVRWASSPSAPRSCWEPVE
jgi:NADPH:quinone reductase-like Zn-dependent oxidoreductase